jgi:predicted nuclease of predicted toxin-antitoxin system
MKFKIDENLPIDVAEVLAEAAHDAVTVDSEGVAGSQDAVIASICQQEERVLVTVDLGFPDIRAYPPQTTPGFIVLRLSRLDKAYVRVVLTGA